MRVSLMCPSCRGLVEPGAAFFVCRGCGVRYPVEGGIVSFLGVDSRFNPGAYVEDQVGNWTQTARLRDRIRRSPFLSFLNRVRIWISLSGRRDRIFLEEMAGGSKDRLILDIGCGGGRHYFCDYGRVVGVDPVAGLLKISAQIYDAVYQASATALPFADNTFDYVVSSDVIGHIVGADKDALFREMHRVLRPGGRAVHVIETDANNRWFNHARRSPELFRKHLVERPGHYGLEFPSQLRERFLRHGFKEVRFRRMCANVWECGTLAAVFDNEYRQVPGFPRARVALDRVLSRNLLVSEFVNVCLELAAKLDDRVAPLDAASGSLVVFEKR